MSKVFGSIYDYTNSVANNAMAYVNDLKTRVTNLESRVHITETYYGEVFFTNERSNSFGQIINDVCSNSFIEHLVAGRAYNYSYWNDDHPAGTYPGRTDANGKYPIALPLPIGSSATLIVDFISNNGDMFCNVYMVLKNEDSSWSYWLVREGTLREYMQLN